MVPVAQQIRNILYHRDFRVDNGVLAADGSNGQLADLQLVAHVHLPARRAELSGGLRIGVQYGIRVALEQRRQPRAVYVIGVLMGNQDGG